MNATLLLALPTRTHRRLSPASLLLFSHRYFFSLPKSLTNGFPSLFNEPSSSSSSSLYIYNRFALLTRDQASRLETSSSSQEKDGPISILQTGRKVLSSWQHTEKCNLPSLEQRQQQQVLL